MRLYDLDMNNLPDMCRRRRRMHACAWRRGEIRRWEVEDPADAPQREQIDM